MPLYEYQCVACEQRFERIQKFSDPPVETCPTCSGKVRKLLSSPAIQFKGSGWYVTDYARQEKKSGGTDKGASSSGSGETKSEGAGKTESGAASNADKPAAAPTSTSSTKTKSE
jgi:putative FmdB family regulatory protein